jgi:hypothetical protein
MDERDDLFFEKRNYAFGPAESFGSFGGRAPTVGNLRLSA